MRTKNQYSAISGVNFFHLCLIDKNEQFSLKEINLHGFTKQTHKDRSMSQDKGKQNYLDFDNIHLSFFFIF